MASCSASTPMMLRRSGTPQSTASSLGKSSVEKGTALKQQSNVRLSGNLPMTPGQASSQTTSKKSMRPLSQGGKRGRSSKIKDPTTLKNKSDQSEINHEPENKNTREQDKGESSKATDKGKKRSKILEENTSTGPTTNSTEDDLRLICNGCQDTRAEMLIECELCNEWLCPRCAALDPKVVKDIGKWSTVHFFCKSCNIETKLQTNSGCPSYPRKEECLTQESEHTLKSLMDLVTDMEMRMKYLQADTEDIKSKLTNLTINRTSSHQRPREQALPYDHFDQEMNVETTHPHPDSLVRDDYSERNSNRPNTVLDVTLGNGAILEEYRDRERRRNNIILHNVPESTGGNSALRQKDDGQFVQNLISNTLMIENVIVRQAIRLGHKMQDKTRPRVLLVEVDAPRERILSKARKLRSHSEYNMIFIDPDRTPAEREAHWKLRKELKTRRDMGEDCLIRKGRITKRYQASPSKGTSMSLRIPTSINEDVNAEQITQRITQRQRRSTTSKFDAPSEKLQGTEVIKLAEKVQCAEKMVDVKMMQGAEKMHETEEMYGAKKMPGAENLYMYGAEKMKDAGKTQVAENVQRAEKVQSTEKKHDAEEMQGGEKMEGGEMMTKATNSESRKHPHSPGNEHPALI